MPDPWSIAALVAIPVLLLLSAVLVSAEIAIVTVRRTELDELARGGDARAAAARAVVERLDLAIASIQIGITSIGLLLGWLGLSRLSEALQAVLPGADGGLTSVAAGGVVLVLLTAVQVVLGELAPKAIALQHPRRVALTLARPLLAFTRALGPLVWLLNGGATLFLRLIRVRPVPPHARAHSVAELAMLVDETQRAGFLAAEQADVLRNVFRLSGRQAREMMVPLERVGVLDLRWPAARVLDAVIAGAHTRMPVCDGERDRLVGLVNTKDLFRALARGGPLDVRAVLRPLTSVDAQARAEDLLRDMRRRRVHLAVVREGTTPLGIVTLEDVLEEIVGEIEDEHDRPAAEAPPA
ncbi:MAG: HlyC/CorC family transporter [Planctomycetes bacterium]|nr:HlyC/CorC family transporter [Planctomycetota bacterium]